jgi:hypothetical protein
MQFPSPLWGRGWTASGAFASRRGPGEGVQGVAATLVLGPLIYRELFIP